MESAMSSNFDDFLQTGRTGRRNAVPDIITSTSASVTTSDLPVAIEKLSCSGNCFN